MKALVIGTAYFIEFGRHTKGIRECDPVFSSGIPYNDAKFDDEGNIRAVMNRPLWRRGYS